MRLFVLGLLCVSGSALAQKEKWSQLPGRSQYFDASAAFGKSQGALSLSWWHHWGTGKKKRLELGVGLRTTAYGGNNIDFITAPASLARGSSDPFVVVFSSQETANWDTVTVHRPLVASINAAVGASWHFTPRFTAGFNIDVIGFTVGNTSPAVFNGAGKQVSTKASPAPFNLLLTGDLDLGSLNSELYLGWRINEKWMLKAVYQFYFAEYITPEKIQELPEPNDRFRNKANIFGAGLRYRFR